MINCNDYFKVKFDGEFYSNPIVMTDDDKGNVTILGITTLEDDLQNGGVISASNNGGEV